MDPVGEIKTLYFKATPETIVRDLARAVDLLKGMATEEERERVAVFMDGLSQMRSEWVAAGKARLGPGPTRPGRHARRRAR
jgi:hypothetical protein